MKVTSILRLKLTFRFGGFDRKLQNDLAMIYFGNNTKIKEKCKDVSCVKLYIAILNTNGHNLSGVFSQSTLRGKCSGKIAPLLT